MSENEKKIAVLSSDIPTEHLIDPNNIWGNDDLKRKPFADDLTRIVEHAAKNQSFAVSLHGNWGTGKTYLLRRWQVQLQKEGRRAVYFNAWEDDFQADALTAVVGQLWEAIKSADWKEIIQSVKTAIPTIAGKKALDFLGLTKEDLQSADERTVDEYLAVRKKLDGFRERLKTLAAAVKSNTNFPLVFIVDELDRCRPTFAIEVLERIKHLFGVPNIVFVFGVNKTGLQKSIRLVYGCINAEDYLRRFFDRDLTLPPADAVAYCQHLLKQNDLEDALNQLQKHRSRYGDSEWLQATHDLTRYLIGYAGLSLREVEHVVRSLRFAINMRIASNKVIAEEAWGIFILAILKIKKSALYAEFVNNKALCATVINYFTDMLPARSVSHDGVSYLIRDTKVAAEMIEWAIYGFALGHSDAQEGERAEIIKGLQLMAQGENIPDSVAGFLSKTTKSSERSHASWLLQYSMQRANRREYDGGRFRKEMAALLDLADDFRR